MRFAQWLETRKDLAKAYKGILGGVPQDPSHHPEGDALVHTRLVRKAIPRATAELRNLQQSHPQLSQVLADLDFSTTPEEANILALAAWLHDIGKASATKVGDKPWNEPGVGQITAYGHQDPEHFLPQVEKLRDVAPPETVDLYVRNKDLVDWLVQRHMDFTQGRFPNEVVRDHFKNGKIVPSPKIKLLLMLMWSDKMGRVPEDMVLSGIAKNVDRLAASSQWGQRREKNITQHNKAPFTGSFSDFVKMLQSRDMTDQQRKAAIKGKFPDMPDDDIKRLYS